MGRTGSPNRRKRLLQISGLLMLIAAGIGAYAGFGPPGLYARSESPELCAQCHVMEAEYENWFHAGAHKRLKCIDCHLPNDNLAHHLVWKGMEGMWDSYVFYSGHVPETIKISEKGAAIVRDNCQRCHAELVSRINEDRNCWQCHRRLSHKTTGAL